MIISPKSATKTTGAIRSNFDGPHIRNRCASSSSPTAATGSRNSTSTACDSTPRRTFATLLQEYIVGEIGRAARAAARERSIILIAENESQQSKLVRPKNAGGDDLDALWNDDFHHSALVALTGRNEAYYTDYLGRPQEFISAAKYGYLFQGQPYLWQDAPRGEPTFGLEPPAFVGFIENHDQVANSAFGERVRLQSSPGRYRAMTALLLLGPWTPMLFQGQEFGATTPFLYFSDASGDLRDAIQKGRFKFLTQFPSAASAGNAGQPAAALRARNFRAQ